MKIVEALVQDRVAPPLPEINEKIDFTRLLSQDQPATLNLGPHKEVHAFWLAGMSCDGCSIAVVGATQPSVEMLLHGTVPGVPKIILHHPVLAVEAGEDFVHEFERAAKGELEAPFVIIFEGSVADESLASSHGGYWSGLGVRMVDGEPQPIPTATWLKNMSEKAAAVIAIGTCATWGGVPAAFGNPDSADLWKSVISRLRNNFRCLAPDLPGFGRSSAPADFDYSLQNMANFVDGLITALGIQQPLNLATHDLGTSFGLAWAIKHPGKVKRIAVSNAMFFSDYRWHFWGQVWRTPLVGELSMILMNWLIFKLEMRRSSRKLTVEHIRNTYALMSGPMKKMIVRLYRASTPRLFTGWEDELLALTARVPTCVLWGDCDPYIPSRYAERFGAQEVHHFPDCGHWLPAEAAEEVAERLIKFFS